MSDSQYMHLGSEAEADDLEAAGKAPVQLPDLELTEVISDEQPFDPLAALQAVGISHMPEPIPAEEIEAYSHDVTLAIDNGVGPNVIGDFTYAGEADNSTEPLTTGVNPKDLIGLTKPDLSLIPGAALLYESQAMMDGAKKYGPYNWRDNPVLYRVYIAAAIRHLYQLLDGEDFDPISGVHHVGHARACLGILADANETGNLVDDRPTKGASGEMIRRFGDTQSFRR